MPKLPLCCKIPKCFEIPRYPPVLDASPQRADFLPDFSRLFVALLGLKRYSHSPKTNHKRNKQKQIVLIISKLPTTTTDHTEPVKNLDPYTEPTKMKSEIEVKLKLVNKAF